MARAFFAFIDRTEPQPAMVFIKAPEGRTARSRLHLGLDCGDLAAAAGLGRGVRARERREQRALDVVREC